MAATIGSGHPSRFVGARHLERQFFENASDLGNLIVIGLRQLSFSKIEIIFKSTNTLPPRMAPIVTRENRWRPAARIER
jgi:hypothetical protein